LSKQFTDPTMAKFIEAIATPLGTGKDMHGHPVVYAEFVTTLKGLASMLQQKGHVREAGVLESITGKIQALEAAPAKRGYLEWDIEGTVYLRKGDYDEAIRCFEMALEINPSYHPALYNLGIAHVDKMEFEKAVECWEKVLKIEPSYQKASAAIAKVRSFTGGQEPIRPEG